MNEFAFRAFRFEALFLNLYFLWSEMREKSNVCDRFWNVIFLYMLCYWKKQTNKQKNYSSIVIFFCAYLTYCLFFYLLWEVILSTITNSWAREKRNNSILPASVFTCLWVHLQKKIIKNSIFILFKPNFQDISPYDRESFPFGTSCVKLISWRPLTSWSCLLYDNVCKISA